MKIDCYISEICSSYHELRENIDKAVSELGVNAEVNYHTVHYEEALSKDIKGSPSIWINGKDAFEGGRPGIN